MGLFQRMGRQQDGPGAPRGVNESLARQKFLVSAAMPLQPLRAMFPNYLRLFALCAVVLAMPGCVVSEGPGGPEVGVGVVDEGVGIGIGPAWGGGGAYISEDNYYGGGGHHHGHHGHR